MATSPSSSASDTKLVGAALYFAVKEQLTKQVSNMQNVTILINGEEILIENVEIDSKKVSFSLEGRRYVVEGSNIKKGSPVIKKGPQGSINESGVITADIPGVICGLNIKVGDKVKIGSELLRLEAMKMQNTVNSDNDGVIEAVYVSVGQEVNEGQALLKIK